MKYLKRVRESESSSLSSTLSSSHQKLYIDANFLVHDLESPSPTKSSSVRRGRGGRGASRRGLGRGRRSGAKETSSASSRSEKS